MKKKNWTGERLETFIQNRDTIEHLHRYAIAAEYCAGKTVLDIASGEGYGSNLLALRAKQVIGVDIDAGTIARARQKYARPNLTFEVGRADLMPLEDHSVDVLVSFETLEHHDRHDEMMAEVKRVLKPGGLMFLSTPDKLWYSDKRNFNNTFHQKELYRQEFEDLVERHFAHQQLLSQTYMNGISILDAEPVERPIIYTGDFGEVTRSEIPALYLVIIASDAHFDRQNQSYFDGSEILEKAWAHTYRTSSSYRIGHFLLSPARLFQRLLR